MRTGLSALIFVALASAAVARSPAPDRFVLKSGQTAQTYIVTDCSLIREVRVGSRLEMRNNAPLKDVSCTGVAPPNDPTRLNSFVCTCRSGNNCFSKAGPDGQSDAPSLFIIFKAEDEPGNRRAIERGLKVIAAAQATCQK
jgi:hypothetical protein